MQDGMATQITGHDYAITSSGPTLACNAFLYNDVLEGPNNTAISGEGVQRLPRIHFNTIGWRLHRSAHDGRHIFSPAYVLRLRSRPTIPVGLSRDPDSGRD